MVRNEVFVIRYVRHLVAQGLVFVFEQDSLRDVLPIEWVTLADLFQGIFDLRNGTAQFAGDFVHRAISRKRVFGLLDQLQFWGA